MMNDKERIQELETELWIAELDMMVILDENDKLKQKLCEQAIKGDSSCQS